ncbi:unnamed protein product, partial [marine sediment metagenome]
DQPWLMLFNFKEMTPPPVSDVLVKLVGTVVVGTFLVILGLSK